MIDNKKPSPVSKGGGGSIRKLRIRMAKYSGSLPEGEWPMSRVMVRHATYDDGALKSRIFELMEAMGGEAIRRGSRVLIKPNLLSPAKPEHAVLTHPALVRAAGENVLERGARPLIADSPAIGAFATVLRVAGIRDAPRGLVVEWAAF